MRWIEREAPTIAGWIPSRHCRMPTNLLNYASSARPNDTIASSGPGTGRVSVLTEPPANTGHFKMQFEFIVQPAEAGLVAELERLQPHNPFATSSFFESRRRLGYSSWVVGLRRSDGQLEAGCGAFLRRGKLNRALEIFSLPTFADDSVFWQGVRGFCSRFDITQLEVGTYASPAGTNPPILGVHGTRTGRCEFEIDLSGDLAGVLSSNHRRNVRKAEKAGLAVSRTRSDEAAAAHQKLMSLSMERRQARGESVSSVGASPEIAALLGSGVGELFQVVREGHILSSVLVLHAETGSYYQSAGTSPDGMDVGASHFLIHHIALELKAAGARTFNLGGANADSSLGRFKKGFGTAEIPMSSVSCYVGPSWRYNLAKALELLRSDRMALRRLLVGQWQQMIVYSADTAAARQPKPLADLEFKALNASDLHAISQADPQFRSRQLERLERFGNSYAYGVISDGRIVHVSWLLPPAMMEKDLPRVICAREGEAEITACETVSEFRGRGIFGFAIHNLLDLAESTGVRRVFMKTAASNLSSQSGIEKAGLKRVGWAAIVSPPLARKPLIWRRFR